MTYILEVQNLTKYFPFESSFLKRRIGWVKAVDNVSFNVRKGEVVGLVGESGCGKSTLGKTVSGIYKPGPGHVSLLRFKGQDIINAGRRDMQTIRRNIQYLFQEIGGVLDPWWTVKRILEEPLIIHTKITKHEREAKVKEIIEAVGLKSEHILRYPHEFSGGEQRRLGLARTLILNPSCIILDEPTSNLDVSVQATILKLLKRLRDSFDLTYLIITHDLAVVRYMCQKIMIMYLGKIVEKGSTESIFKNPLHPYTIGLLQAVPDIDTGSMLDEKFLIEDEPPDPKNLPSGCRFRTRCSCRQGNCSIEEPTLTEVEPDHEVACYLIP